MYLLWLKKYFYRFGVLFCSRCFKCEQRPSQHRLYSTMFGYMFGYKQLQSIFVVFFIVRQLYTVNKFSTILHVVGFTRDLLFLFFFQNENRMGSRVRECLLCTKYGTVHGIQSKYYQMQ